MCQIPDVAGPFMLYLERCWCCMFWRGAASPAPDCCRSETPRSPFLLTKEIGNIGHKTVFIPIVSCASIKAQDSNPFLPKVTFFAAAADHTKELARFGPSPIGLLAPTLSKRPRNSSLVLKDDMH